MKLSTIESLVPSRTQLPLPDDLTYEEWEDIGRTLDAVEAASQWWRGDWLNYGERKYGEKYAQAIEVTGKSPQGLMNAAWVAGKFETSRRRETLSWSHHAEVAALDHDIQDQLLDQAESEEWTRNVLRDAVRRYRLALANPDGDDADAVYEITSERTRQLAGAQKKRLLTAMSGIEGFCTGLATLKLNMAFAVMDDDERRDWARSIRDSARQLSALAREVEP